jgi:type IV/VI secretion system ImpK/VasF family protein
MTPDFVPAALPLFAEIVSLSELAARGGPAAEPEEVRHRFLRAMEAATAKMRGPRGEEWTLASYAFACLIDELMIVEISWPGRDWWENHAVEVELFGTRRRATEFFDRVKTAASYPDPSILSIYVGAVVMGFRGILRDKPEALEAWMRANGQAIRVAQGRPDVPTQGSALPGAAPLGSATSLAWQLIITLMATAILIVTAWWAFVVS